MTTTSNAVDHGITINASTHEPPRFEALCLCGFASKLVPDRRRAVAAGQWHVADERLTLSKDDDIVPPAEAILIPTSDRGDHPFPEHCPVWCDRGQHLDFAVENEGLIAAAEMTRHFRSGGDTFLPEIRNSVSKRIERDGGGAWILTARQALQEPWLSRGGYESCPMVDLSIFDRGLGAQHQAFICLTTGEARVLAAHLSALCDHVDLPRVTR